MAMWWYGVEAAGILLAGAGAGGPTEVAGTETFTISESAVAQLLPAATDTITVSDAATGQVLAIASDSGAHNESSVATLGEAVSTLENLSLTDALTTLQGLAVPVDTGTLSEATTVPADAVASDSGTLSETRLGFADVVAVDAFAVSELATPTLLSSGNISDSDALAVSESIATIPVTVVATESLTVTDTHDCVGILARTDSAVVSEASVAAADLTGEAEFGSLSIGPRITVNPSAGRIAYTCDSTYITCDSTLVTVDGSYVGDIPNLVGVRVRDPIDEASVGERVGGLAGVGV